jgi:YesN/AraC family two-component response regulator
MKIYIKNMVCNRCKWVVESELVKLGLQPIAVELGEVELSTEMTSHQIEALTRVLHSLGFDLIMDEKVKSIEKIKNLIIEVIYNNNNQLQVNLSTYLVSFLKQDYNVLSNLFSEIEGTTIEKYYILQKIERVKELLTYNEKTLSEIAFLLDYSSVAYLSNQFKKVTGVTPSSYKQLKEKNRQEIDELTKKCYNINPK